MRRLFQIALLKSKDALSGVFRRLRGAELAERLPWGNQRPPGYWNRDFTFLVSFYQQRLPHLAGILLNKDLRLHRLDSRASQSIRWVAATVAFPDCQPQINGIQVTVFSGSLEIFG
jgi:hypothetical protein